MHEENIEKESKMIVLLTTKIKGMMTNPTMKRHKFTKTALNTKMRMRHHGKKDAYF